MKKISMCLLLFLISAGCSTIMHELQPHRLRRLNYQDPVGRTDGVYFSVEDRLPDPVLPSTGKEGAFAIKGAPRQ